MVMFPWFPEKNRHKAANLLDDWQDYPPEGGHLYNVLKKVFSSSTKGTIDPAVMKRKRNDR